MIVLWLPFSKVSCNGTDRMILQIVSNHCSGHEEGGVPFVGATLLKRDRGLSIHGDGREPAERVSAAYTVRLVHVSIHDPQKDGTQLHVQIRQLRKADRFIHSTSSAKAVRGVTTYDYRRLHRN